MSERDLICARCNVQEAEIEEDVEATRVIDWDTAAADAAYRAKVEEAEARQRLLLEQRAREVGHCCAQEHSSQRSAACMCPDLSSVASHPLQERRRAADPSSCQALPS